MAYCKFGFTITELHHSMGNEIANICLSNRCRLQHYSDDKHTLIIPLSPGISQKYHNNQLLNVLVWSIGGVPCNKDITSAFYELVVHEVL